MRLHIMLGQTLHAHIENNAEPVELPPLVSYRHHYHCWACRCAGVLEFEPDDSEPSWTECRHCGIDNEISPGHYEQRAIIAGQVPTRII